MKELFIVQTFDKDGFLTGYEIKGEVVRCKDCIHNQVATWNHGIRDKPRCNFTNYVRSNEFFCGFGERRSE